MSATRRRPTSARVALAALVAVALGGCAGPEATAGPKEREAAPSSAAAGPASGPTAGPVPATPSGSDEEVVLVIAADDVEPVVLSLIEQFESGWERGLDDHTWTVGAEDLFDRLGEVAADAGPGTDLEVAASSSEVGALLATLDREAGFFATAGMAETAEDYVAAADHVRAQLPPDAAVEVERWVTEPRAAWEADV
ncbi:hypothetical protein ICW40_08105 [Actinotalea ferrariae]|uniref:hypothetical protein n=1 Tax=Actinotalea ferrariae TaxID=1386098 RepID=UPI001C8C0CEA|nr:hypothetical protein [Actinotalea ferrariae]MBX9244772.1 hypothetical protein [Actinotalea ferrariae]